MSSHDELVRTYTMNGTDITDKEAKSFMKLKKLLKQRGIDAKVVTRQISASSFI